MSRTALVPWAVLLAAAAGVAVLQPRLARAAHEVGERENTYPLPPPDQLHAATLGWDAAAVDCLWADLLVEYGTHWSEHQEFEDTGRYADTILEIEPGYRPLYRYIDTMMVYRPIKGTAADARAARTYLERAIHEYPSDAAYWLEYGQFVAFIGDSFLTDPQEQAAWRAEGALAMERAVELGARPDRALTAASLLTRSGQLSAAIDILERQYAFTDNPAMTEMHEAIGLRIRALRDQLAAESGVPPALQPQ